MEQDTNKPTLFGKIGRSEQFPYILLIGLFLVSWVIYSFYQTRLLIITNTINYLPLVFHPHQSTHYYYVDSKKGSDLNPGSENKPWKTLQKAAETAQPGDYIFVRSGNYSGFSLKRSGLPDRYITFSAYPGDRPVIIGNGGEGIHNFEAENYPLEYFIIDGFEIKYFEHGIYLKEAKNFILQNNHIHHNHSSGITIDHGVDGIIRFNSVHDSSLYNGIWLSHSFRMNVHNNQSFHNRQNGIGLSEDSQNNEIHHNVIYNNSCMNDISYAGLAVEVNSRQNLIYMNLSYENCHAGLVINSPDNKIYNNVFADNGEFQVLLGDWQGSIPQRNEFKNNIFYFNNPDSRAVGFFRSEFSYNPFLNFFDYNLYDYVAGPDKSDMILLIPGLLSFQEWQKSGQEAHGVLGDPKFINPYLHDYRLLRSSPAIDVGVDVGLREDFDLNLIPIGNGFDIGAYEQ